MRKVGIVWSPVIQEQFQYSQYRFSTNFTYKPAQYQTYYWASLYNILNHQLCI